MTDHVVDSFRIGADDGKIKCGMGVVHGTVPGTDVALPTASSTIDKFAGIVMSGGSNEMDMNGNVIIRSSSSQSVMRSGRVWVRLAAGAEPAYGQQAHLIIAGDDAGCFGITGGVAVNASFLTTAQNGIAAVELYNQLNAAPAGGAAPSET